jgi:protein-tyrosine-phosphatase
VKTVLFVCHANTARSIIAQVLLERMVTGMATERIHIRSGGIANYARDRMPPSLVRASSFRRRHRAGGGRAGVSGSTIWPRP